MKKTQKYFRLKTSFLLCILGAITSGIAQSQTTISFTTPGTTNWTVPAGVSSVTVECWGAGGAGGGVVVPANIQQGAAGGGGKGGMYTITTVAVTPGNQLTISVGAGGTGTTSAGNPGGASWASTVATAPWIGTTGAWASGGNGGSGATTNIGGGASSYNVPGNGSGTIYDGGNGAAGRRNGILGQAGGGGGGGAGNSASGNDATVATTNGAGTPTTPSVVGAGGTSFGGNGGAGAYNTSSSSTNIAVAGAAGSIIGGAGGGARGSNDNSLSRSASGGAGARGEVRITYTACPVPSQPTSINGTTTVCSGVSQTYSVTNDASATGYTWTLPSGYSGTSTTNSINATAGATGGAISVTADNACGSSTPQTINITVNTAVPSQPSAINGAATVCASGSQTYSVTNDPTATNYTWSLPSGYSGTSTTNSINATAGTTGGDITVTANNACGSSAQQTLTTTVVSAVPSQPSAINGTAAVCTNVNQTYDVTNDPTATDYTWSLPSGYSGTSTTNAINATAGTTGGTISVTANNVCGSSTPQTLSTTVSTAVPSQPTSINGANTVCVNDVETYNVTNDPTATSYTWTLPSGYSGTSATNSINATSGATGGTISVTANNACGSSTPQTLSTTVNDVPAQPSAISGTTTVCAGAIQTYGVTNDPTATSYTWTLPSGYSGTSATNSISATAGTTGGTISVTANNACGSSTPRTVTTTVNDVNSTIAVNGIVLTSNQAGASYRWLDCNNGNAVIPGAISQSYTPTANGSYAVEVTINGCTETSSCSTISTVGIDENTLTQTIKLYPNPTNGKIQIELGSNTENLSLSLVSISGKVIESKNSFGNSQLEWNIEQPSGIYFIEILNNAGEKAVFRIIKE